MDWKTWTLQTLQNKYVAATLLAVVWSTFIHDLGMLTFGENLGPCTTLSKNFLRSINETKR